AHTGLHAGNDGIARKIHDTLEQTQSAQHHHDHAAVKYDADALPEVFSDTACQNDGLALDVDGNNCLEGQHADDTRAIAQCGGGGQESEAKAHDDSRKTVDYVSQHRKNVFDNFKFQYDSFLSVPASYRAVFSLYGAALSI